MNIILSESQLDIAIKKWIDVHYGQLKKSNLPKHHNIEIFHKNDDVILIYDKSSKKLLVANPIFEFLLSILKLTDSVAKSVIFNWVADSFNIHPKKIVKTKEYSLKNTSLSTEMTEQDATPDAASGGTTKAKYPTVTKWDSLYTTSRGKANPLMSTNEKPWNTNLKRGVANTLI